MNSFTTIVTDNGPLATEYLSFKRRDEVVETLYDYESDDEKANIKELLQRFNVISRSISHTRQIDADKFEDYCYETLEFMKTKFKFMPIPRSIHESIAHAAQSIRDNGGKSLGQLSEAPLEVIKI